MNGSGAERVPSRGSSWRCRRRIPSSQRRGVRPTLASGRSRSARGCSPGRHRESAKTSPAGAMTRREARSSWNPNIRSGRARGAPNGPMRCRMTLRGEAMTGAGARSSLSPNIRSGRARGVVSAAGARSRSTRALFAGRRRGSRVARRAGRGREPWRRRDGRGRGLGRRYRGGRRAWCRRGWL